MYNTTQPCANFNTKTLTCKCSQLHFQKVLSSLKIKNSRGKTLRRLIVPVILQLRTGSKSISFFNAA